MSSIKLGDLRRSVSFEIVHDTLDPAYIVARILDLFEEQVGDVHGGEQFKTDLRDLVPGLINSSLHDMLVAQDGDDRL